MAQKPLPLDVGAYLADTTHLSTIEHGAYLLLIMAYWQNGGEIARADIGQICKLERADAERVAERLAHFWTIGKLPGHWRHERIEADLEKTRILTSARKLGAEMTNAQRYAQRYAERPAQRFQSAGVSVLEEEDKTVKEEGNGDQSDNAQRARALITAADRVAFEAARIAYPGTKRGGAVEWDHFKRKFNSQAHDIIPLLLPAIDRYRAHLAAEGTEKRFIAHFKTWINQQRWTEEVAAGVTHANGHQHHSARAGASAREYPEQLTL